MHSHTDEAFIEISLKVFVFLYDNEKSTSTSYVIYYNISYYNSLWNWFLATAKTKWKACVIVLVFQQWRLLTHFVTLGMTLVEEGHLIWNSCSIACSTAECERGFSHMNIITNDKRSNVLVSHVSSLMWLHGPPLSIWKSRDYSTGWRRHHRSAADTQTRLVYEGKWSAIEMTDKSATEDSAISLHRTQH